MKTISIIIAGILLSTAVQAKTFIIKSGKWTDPKVWGNRYIGSTIKAGDTVIVTGQITLNTALTINGTLQIKKGAGISGMENLLIAKTGKLVNSGTVVVKEVVNRGSISNNAVMESMTNIQNAGAIENNSNMIAGVNFESSGGNASGRGGRFYANNTASVSASTTVGSGISIFSGPEKK